jgi:hypothetical protein
MSLRRAEPWGRKRLYHFDTVDYGTILGIVIKQYEG